jgi:hypothetical protein
MKTSSLAIKNTINIAVVGFTFGAWESAIGDTQESVIRSSGNSIHRHWFQSRDRTAPM